MEINFINYSYRKRFPELLPIDHFLYFHAITVTDAPHLRRCRALGVHRVRLRNYPSHGRLASAAPEPPLFWGEDEEAISY